MNEVLQTLMNHRSYHQYTTRPVDPRELDAIIRAAQAGASWIHGQQVSIIAVQNPERKQKLSELAGNQKHVAQAPVFLVFCADFYRAKQASEMEGQPFAAAEDADMLLVGATDVGISMGNAMAAAESLGLGVLPVGGIRKSPLEVVKLLNLPEYVFPVAGLCIGYPDEDISQKPRLPKHVVCHEEEYNTEVKDELQAYNHKFRQYLKAQGKPEMDWTARVAGFYGPRHYIGGYEDVARMLRQQGFSCTDLEGEQADMESDE